MEKQNEKTIEIKFPYTYGNEEIKVLKMQPPKGRQMRHLSTNVTMGELMDLGAKCCGLTPKALDDMAASDVILVVEAAADFLGLGQ